MLTISNLKKSYDLCVETARFGIDKAAEIIAAAAKLM